MKNQIFTYAFLASAWFVSAQTEINVNPHLNTNNYAPITSVKYQIGNSIVTQTQSATGANAGTSRVDLIEINAQVSPSDNTPLQLIHFNFEGVQINNVNLTNATTGVGVWQEGVNTLANNNLPNFINAVKDNVSNGNVRSKIWYDNPTNLPCNTLPPTCTTPDFDLQFGYAFESTDYIAVGERWGNSTFKLRALDANGNQIGNTICFGCGGGNAYQKYDWNTGYAATYQSTQAMAFSVIPMALFAANQPIFGLRIFNSVDQADVKFFGLSDNTFANNPVNPNVSGIRGNLFHDINGLTDNTVNGNNIHLLNGQQVYAHLVNTSGDVIMVKPIDATTGTYAFFDVSAGTYSVRISTTQGTVGNPAPAVVLPGNWVSTGENIGTSAGNDGTANGIISVVISNNTPIENVNFGVQQIPTTGLFTAADQPNPGGTTTVTVDPTYFEAADADGQVTDLRITTFPSNTTTLVVGSSSYTAANFPVGGVTVTTNANGEPTQTIEIDPIDGVVAVVISFKSIDNANMESTTTGSVTLPFTQDILIDNFYPATGYGTLAYEDLWPARGDYDFNDAVIDYRFKVTTNSQNKVTNVQAQFVLRAFGAGYRNGFGFQFNSNTLSDAQLTATGSKIFENLVTIKPNGFEDNQNKPTIIVYDNSFRLMQHPGAGIGVNTDPAGSYVQPDTITIEIAFPINVYTYNDLNFANFNPFIFSNATRSREVHLPNMAPTALADNTLFGTVDDDSNVGAGRTYVTENNLPWAINIVESFEYPKEKVVITDAHLKFAQWVLSGGTQYADWFRDLPGYRNNSNIYQD